MAVTWAAILARGLGSRMQRADAAAVLDPEQAAAANLGLKGMIPIPDANGGARPFLDYVLSALADAGITDVVLVIGPEHAAVRTHFTTLAPPSRVRLHWAIQPEPLGTANAVVVAATVVGDRPFLVLNADNYYPPQALQQLAQADGAATIAFDRDVLVRDGNIAADRVRAFAVLAVEPSGALRGVVEKPGETLDLHSEAARWVGMNCWTITPALVAACARVPKSVRGEFELPEAVALALRDGIAVHATRMALPVLDLSHRTDVAGVVAKLQSIVPQP